MKISIGTANQVKVKAIKTVLGLVYPFAEYVVVDAESGVSPNPRFSEEGILGALNRAKTAMDQTDSDLSVGAEGVTAKNGYGTFVVGWVVIVDKTGKTGIGSSGWVQLPQRVTEMLDNGVGLAEAMSAISKIPVNEIRFSTGSNGILTRGVYDRFREFSDAVRCALGPFVSEYYQTEQDL